MPEITRAHNFTTSNQRRSQLIGNLLDVLGDTPRLWVPSPSETTTATDASKNQATLTHNATAVGRIGALGSGHYVSYDGSTNYSTFPDAADLSWGNGTDDTAFSAIALVHITNTANNRTIFGKFTTNQREYRAYISTADLLAFELYDQSATATEAVITQSAVTQGSWVFLAFTYDGSEDSDGMTIYVNGVVPSLTRTSDSGGTYAAMENGTSVLGIGAGTNSASLPFQGNIALFGICNSQLSADKIWQVRSLLDGHYGFLG